MTLRLDRLRRLVKGPVSVDAMVERIPYLGLDLEEVGEDHIRVEYNPNRVDYSTDYGIARALNGLFGFERGCPEYTLTDGMIRVLVDRTVANVRPYIVSLAVKDLRFDDESIRQIIAMQEDIHNGMGRKRRKVSIGIHNLDVVEPPIKYSTAPPEFRFTPLGSDKAMSMQEILEKTDVGSEYGWIISGTKRYPILTDARGEVLSFPPIINGELTRVTSRTENIFIDITATDLKTAENALAILSTTLQDAGGSLETVEIEYPKRVTVTPDLKPYTMNLDPSLANRLLGLSLSEEEVVECLEKCRIDASLKKGLLTVVLPRYRFEVMHEVDLVEEVAIGYGLEKFTPTLPATAAVGKLREEQKALSQARETLITLGLTEVMNFSLTSKDFLYRNMNRRIPSKALRVKSPKSIEHEFLRDSLIPSLLANLSKNVHEEYPQRIFEISKTFHQDDASESKIREDYHVAVVSAHSTANFTEAKSYLESFLSQTFDLKCATSPVDHYAFSKGRAAEVKASDSVIGAIGEVDARILESFRLRTPVSAYELDLGKLISS